MVSFQHKLLSGLHKRGIQTARDLGDLPFGAVLVIGGTRDLPGLWRAKRLHIPIVQRLDGMNWLHRLEGIGKAGFRRYFRSEYGNLLLALIRRRFATRVVYQSMFSKQWWERMHGRTPVEARIIHNGVDLAVYRPSTEVETTKDRWRILMVEGSLMGGYEQGLSVAVQLIEMLANKLPERLFSSQRRLIELMVVGRTTPGVRQNWDAYIAASRLASQIQINWVGQVPPERIPELDRSAHMLYSSDIHPACPNSVIEALACGLPVLSFNTGALTELVPESAGRIVPYGGDPWKLDQPDIPALVSAAIEILEGRESMRSAARRHAEREFGLDPMVDAYLDYIIND